MTAARSSTEVPQTHIDLGDRRSVVVVRRGAAAETLLELPISPRRTAEEFFHHDPPRPAEIEAAIDAVEDQMMRVAGRLPAGSVLLATGACADEICRTLSPRDSTDAVVRLDEVERLFQRLAFESLGNPAARHGLPAGNDFVAAALILREFMHHLGFAAVVFPPAADQGARVGTFGPAGTG